MSPCPGQGRLYNQSSVSTTAYPARTHFQRSRASSGPLRQRVAPGPPRGAVGEKALIHLWGSVGTEEKSATRSQHQARESPVSGKQPRPLKRQKPVEAAEAGTAGTEKPRASSIHGSGEPAPPPTRQEREKVGNSGQSAWPGGGAGPPCSGWAWLLGEGEGPRVSAWAGGGARLFLPAHPVARQSLSCSY